MMEAVVGARLLGEVEEMSLEEILTSLRTGVDSTVATNVINSAIPTIRTQPGVSAGAPAKKRVKLTHMSSLDQLAARHFRETQSAPVSISGRHLALLYTLLSNLVSPPHLYTILLIDLENRFDATRLTCPAEHLRHIYILRPARASSEHLQALVAEADNFMLYGDASRASAGREWWGTVVVGGLGAGDLLAGWKGWLRVEREWVRGFAAGLSVEEALAQRERREEAVEAAGWAATSLYGGFVFDEDGERRVEG